MLVTITKTYKKKIKTKRGDAMSFSIKTKEHGDKWIGGFEDDTNKNWKIGDKVEIEITENGEYTNFKIPKKKLTEDRIREIVKEELDKRFTKLNEHLNKTYSKL